MSTVSQKPVKKKKKHPTPPDNHHIRTTRSRTPTHTSVRTSPINKSLENKLRALMRRRFGKNSNYEGERPNSMPPNGNVVEIVEEVDTEGVDEALSCEYGGVYPDGRVWSGNEIGFEGADSREKICTGKTFNGSGYELFPSKGCL